MGFSIMLLRPDAETDRRWPDPAPWSDSKYVGNREFFSMASDDAEWNDRGMMGESCMRPKDIPALRERVKAQPPGDCEGNVEIWLALLDALEADPELYMDWC